MLNFRVAFFVISVVIFAAPTMSTPTPNVNLDIKVDVHEIGKSVASAIASPADRAAFTKDAAEKLSHQLDGKYNVMIFNLQQDYEWVEKNVDVFYASTEVHGIKYGMWAFESGVFDNKGDGGYMNWAMKGHFTRSGPGDHHVVFTVPEKLKYHTIVDGDILYDLAIKYKTTEDKIKELNPGLSAEGLKVGNEIKIRE